MRRKLHSQSGAALLLALLMLLLCIMVASSILAAAVSNAGRIKSNRIEQQKYMTLTSAVRLICDELEKVSYTAKYEKYEWEAADGKHFHIKQISGDYSGSALNAQIPLGKWLNHIFFVNVKAEDKAGYQVLTDSTGGTLLADGTYTCDLKVTLPDNLKGYPYKVADSPQEIYQVDKTVTVQVKINPATHNITLTAWLGKGDYDLNDPVKVTAELVASKEPSPFINPHGTGSALPELDPSTSENALPLPEENKNKTATVTVKGGTTATFTTIKKETLTSMKWKLNWIKKGE